MIETNVYSRKNIGVDEYQHYGIANGKEIMLDDKEYQAFVDVYHLMLDYNEKRGEDYITSVSVKENKSYTITHK